MNSTTDWIQTALLAANAFLIGWYLRETIMLRRAAEKQVALGKDELESHAKPALVARPASGSNSQLVELVNIGSGPALHLEFFSVPRKSTTRELVSGIGFDRITYLERQTCVIHVRTREPEIPGMNTFFLDSSSRSLRCEYRSLSGRVYFSVFDFDHVGNFVEDTHFGECATH